MSLPSSPWDKPASKYNNVTGWDGLKSSNEKKIDKGVAQTESERRKIERKSYMRGWEESKIAIHAFCSGICFTLIQIPLYH